MAAMSIMRVTNQTTGTVVLTYAGQPITPEMNPKDPEQLLEVLSNVINAAYNKLRDGGLA
jgi:hypothetical protein